MGRKGKLVKRYSWRVLYDPLPVGGFNEGILFSTEDVIHMLRLCTFTLGTVVKHRTWGKFKVVEGSYLGSPYQLRNSKYMAMVSTGQKLKLVEFDKQSSRRYGWEVTA